VGPGDALVLRWFAPKPGADSNAPYFAALERLTADDWCDGSGYSLIARSDSYLPSCAGGYRITDTQLIDFHVAIGLNDNAPAYIFGVGYSFRSDRMF
jgi:hypothetical protein